MRTLMKLSAIVLLGLIVQTAALAQSPFSGKWISDRGPLTLKQSGNRVTGSYGQNGTLTGTLKGDKVEFKYKLGKDTGTGKFEMKENELSFSGSYSTSYGGGGVWRGWKVDPKASTREKADFSGVWLTSWGTMQLEQTGEKIAGKYGAQGWKTLKGSVSGGTMTFNWKQPGFAGETYVELSPDGDRFFGATKGQNPSSWVGMRLKGFDLHVEPKAGEVVEGRAKNGMLYHLRMPDDWKPGDETDVVVLLHGSNWTTKGMVWVTAKNWPDVGKKFAIIGIQGENWASWSDQDDLRFNYTYVNWVGKSTYGGYPFTDRESPYLVAQVIDELTEKYKFERKFVGGHSQGGYLTYVLQMNYPDKFAGTFPIAGGLIFQAEPEAFDDEPLIESQKSTPMVILHGKQDQVVPFSMSEYAYGAFLAHEFPHVRFYQANGGHPYDFLPIGDTIEWLDMMSTDDNEALAKFTYDLAKKKRWRDVGSAIARAKEINGGKEFAKVWEMYEKAAKEDAEDHMRAIESNRNGKWVDDFLAWQEKFYLTKAAKPLNKAFAELRAEHDDAAKELATDASKAFNSGNGNLGWQLREEIVDKYYASKKYVAFRDSVAKRRKKRR